MFNAPKSDIDVLINIGKTVDLIHREDKQVIDYTINLAKLSPNCRNKVDIDKLIIMKRPFALMCYCTYKMYQQGLKVFNINKLDFEALTQMELSLTIEDYSQPYETMIIVPSIDYIRNNINQEYNDRIQFVTINLRKDINAIICLIAYNNGKVTTVILNMNSNNTIGEQLKSGIKSGIDENNTQTSLTSNYQIDYCTSVVIGSLNAVLIIDEIGEKGLIKLKTKKSKKDHSNTNKTVYEFNQTVKLYDIGPELNEIRIIHEGDSGRIMPIHWRRGHWKIQRYGKSNLEKKRIRIKPILVNKKFFVGDLKNTKTEYNYDN